MYIYHYSLYILDLQLHIVNIVVLSGPRRISLIGTNQSERCSAEVLAGSDFASTGVANAKTSDSYRRSPEPKPWPGDHNGFSPPAVGDDGSLWHGGSALLFGHDQSMNNKHI